MAPSEAKYREKRLAAIGKSFGKVLEKAKLSSRDQVGGAVSRLEHGLKFYVIRGGCASSQFIEKLSNSEKYMLIDTSRSVNVFGFCPETSLWFT